MRNAIVNATTAPRGGPQSKQEKSMSPHNTNNKSGGSFGRAASGTASRCDAARADNLRDPGARPRRHGLRASRCWSLNAPDLWPQLFLR